MSIRLLQVGLGKWGAEWATESVPQVTEARAVGWVDQDSARRAGVREVLGAPDGMCFRSLTEALTAVESDAVLVTTRVESHLELVGEAINAGKHVLVEKPFAGTLGEARRLAAAARRRGVVLMVSQQFRFYPAARMAADIVRDGLLGRPSSVEVDFRQLTDHEPGDPRAQLYGVRHALLASHNHPFDLMRMVLGQEAVRVYCRAWQPAGSRFAFPPAAAATIDFGGGTVVSYRGSLFSRGPATTYSGDWRMEFEGGDITWRSHADRRERSLDGERLVVRRREGPEEVVELAPMPLFGRAASLAWFCQATRADVVARADTIENSADDNLGTMALVEAAIASSETGRIVELTGW